MKKVYKLRADAPDLIARAGAQRKRRDPTADDTLKAFATEAGIAAGTLHALINPAQQQLRTRGGMHRQTAWKIAGTLARWSGMDEDAAYQAMIVEELAEPTEPAADQPREPAEPQRDSLSRSAIR